MNDDFIRETEVGDSETGFADGFPFLLISQESLDLLNSKLQRPVAMENFRPNIVVTGCLRPFEEDAWKGVEFSSSRSSSSSSSSNNNNNIIIKMECVNPCSRCKVPNNDPETGVFDAENEPTVTLKTFRSGESIGLTNTKWQRQLFVGQHLAHRGVTGWLEVNDTLDVTSFNDWRRK